MKSMDEVYASLAYDGAPPLRIHFCVSRAFLVYLQYHDSETEYYTTRSYEYDVDTQTKYIITTENKLW